MRIRQIAALVHVSEETLVKHFRKTIANARAEHALKLLEMVNVRAEDYELGKKHDFQALQYLLDRQDPEPERANATVFIQPLPKEIFELPPAELTKQLKYKKEET